MTRNTWLKDISMWSEILVIQSIDLAEVDGISLFDFSAASISTN